MKADQLHVFTARFNPLRWAQPHRHYCDWAEQMLDSGVKLTVVELAYGESDFQCNVSPHINHVGLRGESWAWSKENLINLGIARVPEAKYIMWADSDVFWRRAGWASEVLEALQHYHLLQPWSVCYDLGPNDEHLATHRSFCSLYADGQPVIPAGRPWWKSDGGPYEYAHSGFAWASKRAILNMVGGLFEYGGMASGDYHMALGAVGRIDYSVVQQPDEAYVKHLHYWQSRALPAINGRVGYVPNTIEHRFHGSKRKRGYVDRWSMFIRHGFDPNSDLKRNSYGVIEWAGNKPELEREWDQYLRSRQEDANTAD